MSVGVIVNGRTLTRSPAEEYHIEFAITFVHQNSGVTWTNQNVN
jgi:hypothetical protein